MLIVVVKKRHFNTKYKFALNYLGIPLIEKIVKFCKGRNWPKICHNSVFFCDINPKESINQTSEAEEKIAEEAALKEALEKTAQEKLTEVNLNIFKYTKQQQL